MTVYLSNVKGDLSVMEFLFERAEAFSIRHYTPAKKNNDNFDITIRCNEEVAETIKSKRTLISLLKLCKL